MSLRNKLFLLFTAAVAIVAALVGGITSTVIGNAFERADEQRTAALVAQFRREVQQRGNALVAEVDSIAASDAMVHLAVGMRAPQADLSAFVNEAAPLAAQHQLDFLELVAQDGAILSSAQFSARAGIKEPLALSLDDSNSRGSFLRLEETPAGSALALSTVRRAHVADRNFYLVGGRRVGREYLQSLPLPDGMRALLYQTSNNSLTDATGALVAPDRLRPALDPAIKLGKESSQTVRWSDDAESEETFFALPLAGPQQETLGVLLLGSSRAEVVRLKRRVRDIALMVGAGGILLGLAFSRWAAARVTRPVEELAAAASEVAAGKWDVKVAAASNDEIGQLAESFNRMTHELITQRDKLLQSERVAAWRELARRLAHELKNPLFPLQITIENMLKAREQSPAEFDEVFRESTATLLAELNNLKAIVGRFSDFSKMPVPERQRMQLNDAVRAAARLFEPQLQAREGTPIKLQVELETVLPRVQADPELLHRALSNLILNAIDAMPNGGRLTLRTRALDRAVSLEVSDTGAGLTPEECARLFTPYYTSKQHGTGLGLAIVQSVVSDHGGRIHVESAPDKGTTFFIELPLESSSESHG